MNTKADSRNCPWSVDPVGCQLGLFSSSASICWPSYDPDIVRTSSYKIYETTSSNRCLKTLKHIKTMVEKQ